MRVTVGICDEEGSPRRVGGQGDILSGAISQFMVYASKKGDNSARYRMQAALAGCQVARMCARYAFTRKQRSMIPSDMLADLDSVIRAIENNQQA